MPWISKEQLASASTPPVDGEYHLSSDVSFRRRQELKDLIEWARRKRFTDPRRHYTRLFMNEEVCRSDDMPKEQNYYRRL